MLIDKNDMDAFSTVCSVCCDSADILRNVNSDESLRKQFNIMIETCLKGEFVEEEDMPSVYLCDGCCEKLIRFNNFTDLFRRNVVRLRYAKVQGGRNEEIGVLKNEVNEFHLEEEEVGRMGCSDVGGGVSSLGNEGVVERPEDVEMEVVPESLDVGSGMSSRSNEDIDLLKSEVNEFHLDEEEVGRMGSSNVGRMGCSDVGGGVSSVGNEGVVERPEDVEMEVVPESLDVGSGMSSRSNEDIVVLKSEVNEFHLDEEEVGRMGSSNVGRMGSSNVGGGVSSVGNEGVVERSGGDVELAVIRDPLDVGSGMSSRSNEDIDVMKNEVIEFHLDEDEMSSSRIDGSAAAGMRLGEVVVKEEEVDVDGVEKLRFGNSVVGIRTRRGDTSPVFQASGQRHVKTDVDTTNPPLPTRNTTVKNPEKQLNFVSPATTNTTIRPIHKKRHTTLDRQPICPVCGKTFRRFRTVEVHMRIHTGDKPHTCQLCGRKFRQRQDLTRHTRVHTREKPYGCVVCGSRFCQSANLIRHMRIHTEEKPYGCEVCGKKFRESSKVTVHMRTHTKDKPYTCKICGKTFSVSSKLNAHTRTHANRAI